MPVTARGAGGVTGWKRASAWSQELPSPVREADIYSDNTVYEELGEDRCLLSDMSLEGLHVLHQTDSLGFTGGKR